MNANGDSASGSRPAVERLFDHTQEPIARLQALRDRMAAAAVGCGEKLAELTSLELAGELMDVEQFPLGAALAKFRGNVGVEFDVHAWRSKIVIGFPPALLFRALDALFGGEVNSRPVMAARELTQIEHQVALRITNAILETFQSNLSDIVAFSAAFSRMIWSAEEDQQDPTEEEVVLASLRILEFGDQVLIAVPKSMLESGRKTLSKMDEPDTPVPDPAWSRIFERNVLETRVDVVATAPGPAMLLGQIAALDVGSVIELNPDALQCVRLMCAGESLFEGRLGQSRGHFTVCLQDPVRRPQGASAEPSLPGEP